MEKIGIVSLFAGYNFGNKLQNYAVEQMLRDEGYIPETFKYEIGEIPIKTSISDKLTPYHLYTALRIRLGRLVPTKNTCTPAFRQLLCLLPARQKELRQAKTAQAEAYRKFDRDYLHFSDRIIKLGEACEAWTEEYSYFVCGSDQVWNPYYASTSKLCFLQFAPPEKRVALAPSFGVGSIPESRRSDFASWLSEIPSLSVREEVGKEIIKELTGRDATVLLDPTMLLDRDYWDDFCQKPGFPLPERYVLSYFLGDRTKEYDRIQKQLAKDLGCEIVNLVDLMQPEYYACSPNEFVYCIKNAQAICTDSFHACVFSILYRKSFTAFERVEGTRIMSSRLQTLLDKFELQECFYHGKRLSGREPDFSRIDSVLTHERKIAKVYLSSAFGFEEAK